jgi:hypothetical protein
MSVKKVLTSVNLLGSIDGITFEAFIIRKLLPNLWKGAGGVTTSPKPIVSKD